jgi:ribosomal protein S11
VVNARAPTHAPLKDYTAWGLLKIKNMAKEKRLKLSKGRAKPGRFFFKSIHGLKMRLFFRKTFTNIFITLADLHNRVVFSLSAGMCSEKNNRRNKVAPFIIEAMALKLIQILRSFKIVALAIIMRSSLRSHLRILISKLSKFNYKITAINDRRIVAHNGVRGRAIKRR